jgi:hypothetical protein
MGLFPTFVIQTCLGMAVIAGRKKLSLQQVLRIAKKFIQYAAKRR